MYNISDFVNAYVYEVTQVVANDNISQDDTRYRRIASHSDNMRYAHTQLWIDQRVTGVSITFLLSV